MPSSALHISMHFLPALRNACMPFSPALQLSMHFLPGLHNSMHFSPALRIVSMPFLWHFTSVCPSCSHFKSECISRLTSHLQYALLAGIPHQCASLAGTPYCLPAFLAGTSHQFEANGTQTSTGEEQFRRTRPSVLRKIRATLGAPRGLPHWHYVPKKSK